MKTFSMKLSFLMAMIVLTGSSLQANEQTKPVANPSDAGLLWRTHDPLFGFAIEIPVGSLIGFTAWATWWTLVGSALYTIRFPDSKYGSLPAKCVGMPMVIAGFKVLPGVWTIAKELAYIPLYMKHAFHLADKDNKYVADWNAKNPGKAMMSLHDHTHIQAGMAFLLALMLYKYWIPPVASYIYNKVPSPSSVFQRISDKLSSKMNWTKNSTASIEDDEDDESLEDMDFKKSGTLY